RISRRSSPTIKTATPFPPAGIARNLDTISSRKLPLCGGLARLLVVRSISVVSGLPRPRALTGTARASRSSRTLRRTPGSGPPVLSGRFGLAEALRAHRGGHEVAGIGLARGVEDLPGRA